MRTNKYEIICILSFLLIPSTANCIPLCILSLILFGWSSYKMRQLEKRRCRKYKIAKRIEKKEKIKI